MSNVTLEIASRKYTIACATGEESHIEMLGGSINSKLSQLENLAGQSPERVLLYAALLLADELHEAKREVATQAEAENAIRLESLADRLEALAMQLENA